MIMLALLTRYTLSLTLVPLLFVAPIAWEVLTHRSEKFTSEEYADILATWLGMLIGVILGMIVFFVV